MLLAARREAAAARRLSLEEEYSIASLYCWVVLPCLLRCLVVSAVMIGSRYSYGLGQIDIYHINFIFCVWKKAKVRDEGLAP